MPELPEVETTRRGLAPLASGKIIHCIKVRQPQLRWPVPDIVHELGGQRILEIRRRAKWLIWRLAEGNLLWHLGMSGSFRGWTDPPTPGRHDHIDLQVQDGHLIRYTDPRRFGALLWTEADPLTHPRLAGLGPEPFDPTFDGDYLWRLSRGRRVSIKSFIMDGRVVVGVGNIYACESLFQSGIHPARAAGRVSRVRYQTLAGVIVRILSEAIEVGGTSLRDFTVGDGTPGYFGQSLQVYGRENLPCPNCEHPIKRTVIGQRSTCFCSRCQR
ncbi:MAG: bifunctional DNA-formamidopyrimidine glycosylase/DNA-(apurinic or apyrimidinic site) lyase [Wenzhouxiangella sp.]|jgi:formamidopyrimidine-DNA glycosylase|nr:bifunctional DNA-formamidopyrimidine glycosylase/DNA-(apurinic or apyrimidinic site) lyase [Wenzhouxiangella sp.]